MAINKHHRGQYLTATRVVFTQGTALPEQSPVLSDIPYEGRRASEASAENRLRNCQGHARSAWGAVSKKGVAVSGWERVFAKQNDARDFQASAFYFPSFS